MPFTLGNLRADLEDLGSLFDGARDLEFRAATKGLGLEHSGLTYQRVPSGYRFPYGHTHKTQEEVYVVVGGSGGTGGPISARGGVYLASQPVSLS